MTSGFLPAAAPIIGEEEVAAVGKVLRSGLLAQGLEVESFEHEFSDAAVHGSSCVAVNSGTSALHLILLANAIGRGDEVIVPSFTFAATANVVKIVGAEPIFVDIRSDTYCIDVDAVEAAVTRRTRAVIAVHLYGHPAEMDTLAGICERRGILLIEDAAQAHLASWKDRRVGTWGHAAAFSFYPTKNMTSGEGGMAVTRDLEMRRVLRLLRNQGQEVRYQNELPGLNNRMTEIHAAIGRVQLRKLKRWTEIRQGIAATYDRHLTGVVTPTVLPEAEHVYHQYTIRLPEMNREVFVRNLQDRGVGAAVYYPVPVHRLPAYAMKCDLPVTDSIANEVVSIPVYPSLTEADVERVIVSVNALANVGIGSG